MKVERVWGMGFTWNGRTDNKSGRFINNEEAIIGWSMEDAPDLFAMLHEVEKNDIIYLKTFGIRNQEIRIWRVGRVTNTFKWVNQDVTKKPALGVKWSHPFDEPLIISRKDSKYKGKNNVYNNTLYREYNPGIVQEVLKYVENKD